MKVVIIASFVSEVRFQVPRLMLPGESLGGSFTEGLGGKGFNMCVAARRCGANVSALIKLGRDPRGEAAANFLHAEGVNLAPGAFTDCHPSGIGVILLDPQGRNCIAVDPGANQTLLASDIEHAAGLIRDADVVLAQLESPIATATAALRVARDAGVFTILNPAPAPQSALPHELLDCCDVITPNETEAMALSGASPGTPWETIADSIAATGGRSVCITLGERGVGLLHHGRHTLIPAPAVDAIDTSGAGDAFNGALAAGLAAGRSLEDACRFASAYASIQVTRRGTAVAMPCLTEIPFPP